MNASWKIAKCLFLLGALVVLGRDHPCCDNLWRQPSQPYMVPADLLAMVHLRTEARLVGEQIKQRHQLTPYQKKTGRNLAVQLQKNSSIQSRLELAKLALASGDTSRAIAMLRHALEKRPWSARIYSDLAVAYLARHEN